MTVLLLLVTFTIFVSIDYIRKERQVPNQLPAQAAQPAQPRLIPSYVSGFALPENLRYHPGHTWALQESPSLVRVGLDDFGAHLAGKLEAVRLPKRGQWIRQGQKFAAILKDGSTAELVSPIEGEVTKVNDALLRDSSAVSDDPYGNGWLISVLSPDATTSFRNLLGGDLARRWMMEAANRLQGKLPALAGAVAQDGGLPIQDLTSELPGQKWSEIASEFFLT